MDDNLKSTWVAVVIISIFIMAIMNFIVLFPAEQGYALTSANNETHYTMIQAGNNYASKRLDNASATANSGFSAFNVEVGFMGSNVQKGNKYSLTSYVTETLSTLSLMIKSLVSTPEGGTNPILIVFGIFSTLIGMYLTFVVIKWIRTGN